MNKDQFQLGQRVKQKDEGVWAYGYVREIKDNSIVIEWDDIKNWCEHFEEEFHTIYFA